MRKIFCDHCDTLITAVDKRNDVINPKFALAITKGDNLHQVELCSLSCMQAWISSTFPEEETQ